MNKKYLFTIVVSILATLAWADGTWSVKTNTGASYDVENVGFFMSTDSSKLFSIVMKDGTTIDGVESVSFTNSTSSIVSASADGDNGLKFRQVSHSVVVSGLEANATVEVYGVNGTVAVPAVKATNGKATINVASLPAGTYILRSGRTAVKFLKK